jgi:translation elongation factor EF-4
MKLGSMISVHDNSAGYNLIIGVVGRYVVSGMRSTREARIGDTLYQASMVVEPLPGKVQQLFTLFSELSAASALTLC